MCKKEPAWFTFELKAAWIIDSPAGYFLGLKPLPNEDFCKPRSLVPLPNEDYCKPRSLMPLPNEDF